MKCRTCKQEIQDAQYCPFCGAQQKKTGWIRQYKWYLTVMAALVVLIGIFTALLLTGGKDNIQPVLAEVSAEAAGDEESSAVVETTVSGKEPAETEEAESQKEPALLAAVPAEDMALRREAGLEAEELMRLTAGTLLEWYGESETVKEQVFYKVSLKDTGQEGYVAAAFCTPVQFVYDKAALTLVDVTDQIYSYDDMIMDLEELLNCYGNRIHVNDIGATLDGRTIYEVILGNENADNHILIQAGMHGREYITSQMVMKMLEYYLYYYEEGSYDGLSYAELFEKTAVHIVPMSNPDGVSISQFGEAGISQESYRQILRESYFRDKELLAYIQNTNEDWYWFDGWKTEGFDRAAQGDGREITYEEYLQQWKANAAGVDLNKNFDAAWESVVSRETPAYANFKGYYSVSEPETVALVNLANCRHYDCFVSYHAMGQLIYYDIAGNTAENSISAEILAKMLSELNCYELAPTTQTKYSVSAGGFSDWIQLEKSLPSVTIEVGKTPCPVTVSEFPSIFERNRETWAMLCNELYYK